jgi:hypothetical protein
MSEIAQETVNLLNFLGQCYNAYDGFDKNNNVKENLDDEFLMDILNTELSEEHYDILPDDYIRFKIWFLEEQADTELVYDTVILKFPADYWVNGKPHLLSSPNKVYEWHNDNKDENLNLRSRSYIKVNIKYEKITISAKEKGSPLTIEDVLFATKGMCLDGNRYVVDADQGGYKIKGRMGNSLFVLEPGIENYEH